MHGAIDGYSRQITYLYCNCDNKAQAVLKLFLDAVEVFGLPSRRHRKKENIQQLQHYSTSPYATLQKVSK